jgi:hypothetical protein
MRLTKSLSLLLTVCSLLCICTATSRAQKRRPVAASIREVKSGDVPLPAPRPCLAAFRDFFKYVQRSDTDIVRDEAAQKRWLSRSLRQEFAQKLATFQNPADDPDYPSNGTFMGFWDYPATYAIAATRRYGSRAVIDVLYKWGPNSNYPGDERTTSFVFLFEDGGWKLDDVYTFRGAHETAESLSQYFREK